LCGGSPSRNAPSVEIAPGFVRFDSGISLNAWHLKLPTSKGKPQILQTMFAIAITPDDA
jgi:hypothetical protein